MGPSSCLTEAESGGKLGEKFCFSLWALLFPLSYFFLLPRIQVCCPFTRISEFVCHVSQKIWLEVELGFLSTLSNRDNGNLI